LYKTRERNPPKKRQNPRNPSRAFLLRIPQIGAMALRYLARKVGIPALRQASRLRVSLPAGARRLSSTASQVSSSLYSALDPSIRQLILVIQSRAATCSRSIAAPADCRSPPQYMLVNEILGIKDQSEILRS
jgi:hypothetical protein